MATYACGAAAGEEAKRCPAANDQFYMDQVLWALMTLPRTPIRYPQVLVLARVRFYTGSELVSAGRQQIVLANHAKVIGPLSRHVIARSVSTMPERR